MKTLTSQQKGSLLAFVAVIFITPDSLFIRLSNVDTWGLVFYRGIIPFFTVFFGMLLIYKLNFFKILFTSGYHGLIYVGTFSVKNITFVVSIQNTNVANTLVMIATAPMLAALLCEIFLKEPTTSLVSLNKKIHCPFGNIFKKSGITPHAKFVFSPHIDLFEFLRKQLSIIAL